MGLGHIAWASSHALAVTLLEAEGPIRLYPTLVL